jgi:hypothetical protein
MSVVAEALDFLPTIVTHSGGKKERGDAERRAGLDDAPSVECATHVIAELRLRATVSFVPGAPAM